LVAVPGFCWFFSLSPGNFLTPLFGLGLFALVFRALTRLLPCGWPLGLRLVHGHLCCTSLQARSVLRLLLLWRLQSLGFNRTVG